MPFDIWQGMVILLARNGPLHYNEFIKLLKRPDVTIWANTKILKRKGLITKNEHGAYVLTVRGYAYALHLLHQRVDEIFSGLTVTSPVEVLPEERQFLTQLTGVVLRVPFETLFENRFADVMEEFGETARQLQDELVLQGLYYDQARELAEEAGSILFRGLLRSKELSDEVYHLQRALTAIVKPGLQPAQAGLEALDQARSMIEGRLRASAHPAFRVLLEDLSRRLADIEETRKALEAEEARLQDLLTALKGLLQASASQAVTSSTQAE
jgi:hypothetical protein